MTNNQNPESEESEAVSLGIQKSELRNSSRGDVVPKDVLDAVNAPGKVFDAAEAARTNRHSGSAGGDQAYSIEIEMEDGRRISRLNSTPSCDGVESKSGAVSPFSVENNSTSAAGISENKPGSISRDELAAKACKGDGFAAAFLKQMQAADWLAGEARDNALNELQKQADLTYGRKTNLLYSGVDSSSGRPGEGALQFLSDNHLSPQEMEKRLSAVRSGRDQLVKASLDLGYDPAAIDKLQIADDDVGSALALYIWGPEAMQQLGREESRDLGNRFLIFGIAPVFGAFQEVEKRWEKDKAELGIQGAVNFYFGTALGAALERMHPLLVGSVAAVGTGALIDEAFLSEEARHRNGNLAALTEHSQGLDAASIVNYSQYTRSTVGPVLFNQAFEFATGGIGLPSGASVSSGLKAEARALEGDAVRRLADSDLSLPRAQPLPLPQVKEALNRLWHMPGEAIQALADTLAGPKASFAFASGSLHEVRGERANPLEQLFMMMASFEEKYMKPGEDMLQYYQRISRDFPKALINERESADVVKQFHENACVCAVGEMALEGKVSQHELWRKYQERLPEEMRNRERKASLADLPALLGEGWIKGSVLPPQLLVFVQEHSCWIAELKLFKQSGHAVFVDGLSASGNVIIRDPGRGTRYEMRQEEFFQYWSGHWVCKQ
ncbi:MAG: hypothetical protein IPK73_09695 [Candidatus Obscuribacter sp.]|nr:hypothetical protein [Candidatus Obscuribacter sp.]